MKAAKSKRGTACVTEVERFQLALNKASDQAIITDPEGVIIYANETALKFTGYGVRELLNQKVERLRLWGGHMPAYFYKELWQTVKGKRRQFTAEIANQKRNGGRYITELRVFPVINCQNEIKYLVGLERNISAEKEIDRTKSEFITLASHQLRTPLTNISLSIDILLRDPAGELSTGQRDCLNRIYHDIHGMADLIGTLLDVSKIQLGSFIVELESTDLIEAAETALSQVMPEIKRKGLRLEKKLDKAIPPTMSDKNIVKIVLHNLLTNAAKYTPNGGTLAFKAKRKKDRIIFIVRDSGWGIPQSDQARIFSQFFRAQNVKKREAQGTGLGLYLSRLLLKSVNGKIWFKSHENQGTSFYVSFPVIKDDPKNHARD